MKEIREIDQPSDYVSHRQLLTLISVGLLFRLLMKNYISKKGMRYLLVALADRFFLHNLSGDECQIM